MGELCSRDATARGGPTNCVAGAEVEAQDNYPWQRKNSTCHRHVTWRRSEGRPMNDNEVESIARLLLGHGESQQEMTRAFLEAAESAAPHLSAGGGPYRSSRGLGAWPLSFYGVGTGQLGDYRSTLMLEQDGTYSHFLIGREGEMETETPHIGPGVDTESTSLGPSFFVQSVVRHDDDGGFVVDRPAWGEGASEPMLSVLVRSLRVIRSDSIPSIFTWESALNDA